MEETIVSVIIPCYNATDYIDTCMNSVMKNYISGMEIIIINNGSTDDTLEKCKKYEQYDFVTVISQENRGHCGSKNTGMDIANGKYIMFIDVDDEFIPGAIEKAISKIEIEKADILCMGYRQIIEKDNKVIKEKNYLPDDSYQCDSQKEIFYNIFYNVFGIPIADIKKWNNGEKLNRHKKFSSLWSHVYKREILNRIGLRLSPELFMYEDGIFNCWYLLECKKATYINESLYLYKKRETGITITKYDTAGVDLKLPLLNERNKLRNHLRKKQNIDILEWYAGSNVLSIMQMCKNYTSTRNKGDAYQELLIYINNPVVQESIQIYPNGGNLKKRIPVFLLKTGKYKQLFYMIYFATCLGVDMKV